MNDEYIWSDEYLGYTHYGSLYELGNYRRATVYCVLESIFILSKWHKGCGFSPEEVRFTTLEAAKKAGEDWTHKGI